MLRFFKRNKKNESTPNDSGSIEHEILNRFEDSINVSYSDRNIKLKDNKIWQEIQLLEKQKRENIALLALSRLVDRNNEKYNHKVVRRKIFKSEFNAKNPPSKESILSVFNILESIESLADYNLPPTDIVFCFQFYLQNHERDLPYRLARNAVIKKYNNNNWNSPELKKIIAGIGKLDADGDGDSVYDKRDFLGEYLDENWNKFDESIRAVIKHCWEPSQKSKPTKKWTSKSQLFIDQNNDIKSQIDDFVEIIELIIKKGKSEVNRINKLTNDELSNARLHYLEEVNEIGLSYLIWYLAMIDNRIINSLIGQLALSSYNKIRWQGSLSTKNGNACMYAFTIMSPKDGITQLLNIRNKTRNKSIKNTANKQLTRKAEELGISKEALLELSVPEYNLKGSLSNWAIGNFTGVIDISDMKAPSSYWVNNNTTKKQKSTPKEISENHKEELKHFKTIIKDLKTAISVHGRRLENSYLDNIEWSIEDWKSNYLDHPFLSQYTSKLIWYFDDKIAGILHNGAVIDVHNSDLDISKYKKVKLWHPIYSDPDVITNWRNLIINNEIKQTFKQAFREIYLVTDAEIATNNYSNRFAAHILYQHQFSALAKTRDWNYTLQGAFDSHNTPSKSISSFQLRAEFWVEAINDETSPSGIYTYVASDQVRIYGGREVLEMQHVPKIVFSEVMRDVDLFVGVTSIGNNPEWEDAGDRRTYWHNYSFGDLNETAKTRKDVLERILPKLKIADRCILTDKFLQVEGKIRSYKIHLGSGNILMTPNDQYLCIVPSSRDKKSKIFLPFDNDRTLSIIISKAILLYDDDKIKDSSITRQIKL